MFSFLRGKIFSFSSNLDSVTLDCGIHAYEIKMPKNRVKEASSLIGEERVIYTHVIMREHEINLYGFLHEIEKSVFKALLRVQGVGTKIALNIMAALTIEEMHISVINGNGRFSRIGGVGEQKSKRIEIELMPFFKKIKYTNQSQSKDSGYKANSEVIERACNALVNLGYTKDKSKVAVNKAVENISSDINVNDLVRKAIQGIL